MHLSKKQLDQITKKQEAELENIDLDPQTKENVRLKFVELTKKFPAMKRHRLMKKAGQFYHINFQFE